MTEEIPEGRGWLCFYCGERFETRAAAEEHFGLDVDDGWKAACVDPLRGDERAVRAELVSFHRELNAARDDASKLRDANEQLDYELSFWRTAITKLKATHPGDLKNAWDSMEGRALAAEAIIAEAAKLSPHLVACARAATCGDPMPVQRNRQQDVIDAIDVLFRSATPIEARDSFLGALMLVLQVLEIDGDKRITALLQANNREVERRRAAEAALQCATERGTRHLVYLDHLPALLTAGVADAQTMHDEWVELERTGRFSRKPRQDAQE